MTILIDDPSGPRDSEQRGFAITRTYASARAFVFDACTLASRRAQWLAPPGGSRVECEIDARAGGPVRCAWRELGGSVRELRGFVADIQRPRRIELRLDLDPPHGAALPPAALAAQPPTTVVVSFDDLGERTQLTVVISFASSALRDVWLRAGLDALTARQLEQLERYLARA